MSNVRAVKKGELLFKEGDKATTVYFVQSGALSACLLRTKKHIDLFPLGPHQVAGEHGLLGQATYTYTAVATAETKVVEFPVDAVKAQVEGSQQVIKMLLKSYGERLKHLFNDIKSVKMERDSVPCPDEQVSRIFGAIFHTANHKGKREKDKQKVTVEWGLFKQYAQRVFGESPKRLEQAVLVLVKLKLAEIQMVKNEEDPDEPESIGYVHFLDLQLVENFFEFYQYYYFKGGKTEVLKPDEMYMNVVAALLKCCEGVEPDRTGVVRLDYPKTLERIKAEMSLTLNADHFVRLESKGLFAKRNATDQGVFLQFEPKEYRNTLFCWKVMREIEKWNEKGFVDLNEEAAKKKSADKPACPACHAEIPVAAKFCPECGHKMVAAA